MIQKQNTKVYDLADRTFQLAIHCRDFVRQLTKTLSHVEYAKQLIRSSSSVAANYIEASESLSRKDFILRIKICRKEVKETGLWLRLCEVDKGQLLEKAQHQLIEETTQLAKIFGSIVEKSK